MSHPWVSLDRRADCPAAEFLSPHPEQHEEQVRLSFQGTLDLTVLLSGLSEQFFG